MRLTRVNQRGLVTAFIRLAESKDVFRHVLSLSIARLDAFEVTCLEEIAQANVGDRLS